MIRTSSRRTRESLGNANQVLITRDGSRERSADAAAAAQPTPILSTCCAIPVERLGGGVVTDGRYQTENNQNKLVHELSVTLRVGGSEDLALSRKCTPTRFINQSLTGLRAYNPS